MLDAAVRSDDRAGSAGRSSRPMLRIMSLLAVAARTLAAAITLSHELRAGAGAGTQIAFAWLYNTESGSYWHNGATGGYTSFVFFNPTGDFAAVVLMNTATGARGSFADLVGQHINQRFAGSPAVSLGN